MRKTALVICEICGGAQPSGTDFVVFHCLAFCSPDCRDDYKTADDERRARKEAAAATQTKRSRAA